VHPTEAVYLLMGIFFMSDAELRRQGRYTWMLFVFTAALMAFMLWQSRATAQAESNRHAGEPVAGLMIETGSHRR
jgi:hypothetical protein